MSSKTTQPPASDLLLPAETVTALLKQYRSLAYQNKVDRGHHAAALASLRNALLQTGILTDEKIHEVYTDLKINPPAPEPPKPESTWQVWIFWNLGIDHPVPRQLIQAKNEAIAEQIKEHWLTNCAAPGDKIEIYKVPIVQAFEQYLEDSRQGVNTPAELQTIEACAETSGE